MNKCNVSNLDMSLVHRAAAATRIEEVGCGRSRYARRRSMLPAAGQSAGWAGNVEERMMGFEPTTFCMASRRSSQLSYIRVAASIASVFGV
jgi:hypothetical protein